MSKSLNNYIGVDESSESMYGKMMSIPDSIMPKYMQLLTTGHPSETEGILDSLRTGSLHPMVAKMSLAREVVSRFWGLNEAQLAEDKWRTVFQEREVPEHVPELRVPPGTYWIVQVLTDSGLVSTRSEARRMIQQGGVKVNGVRIDDETVEVDVQDGLTIQVGKRKFARCKV